jgi:hypothetical protein
LTGSVAGARGRGAGGEAGAGGWLSGLRTGGGVWRHQGASVGDVAGGGGGGDAAGGAAGRAAEGCPELSRTGGGACHQSPSAGRGGAAPAGAADSAGRIGTMSPTEPDCCPLSGSGPPVGGWGAAVSVTRRSAGIAKIFRQPALGQRIDCPRSVGCNW